MKSLNQFINENKKYKIYTCYFSAETAIKLPYILFGEAFGEELIIKELLNTYGNCIKTNESGKSVNTNVNEHIDLKWSESNNLFNTNITRKLIDVKRTGHGGNIKVKEKDWNSNIYLASIIWKNNKHYVVICNKENITNKELVNENNNIFYKIHQDELYEKADNRYLLEGELLKKYIAYKKIMKELRELNIPPVEANSDIKKYKEAAKFFLLKFTPFFEQNFYLTPNIEFV